MANGFKLGLDDCIQRQFQVLAPAGGWSHVLDEFESVHVRQMDRVESRFMVLLIDFDRDCARLQRARERIPAHLTDRVFVLGVWSEPERLKADIVGSYEDIGIQMAADCREGTDGIWSHDLLRHNAGELQRLRDRVHGILF